MWPSGQWIEIMYHRNDTCFRLGRIEVYSIDQTVNIAANKTIECYGSGPDSNPCINLTTSIEPIERRTECSDDMVRSVIDLGAESAITRVLIHNTATNPNNSCLNQIKGLQIRLLSIEKRPIYTSPIITALKSLYIIDSDFPTGNVVEGFDLTTINQAIPLDPALLPTLEVDPEEKLAPAKSFYNTNKFIVVGAILLFFLLCCCCCCSLVMSRKRRPQPGMVMMMGPPPGYYNS